MNETTTTASLPKIKSLTCYPIKSCGGIDLEEATLTPYGLHLDRHWLVHNAQGEVVTQRTPFARKLALVKPEILEDALRITAPSQSELIIPLVKSEENITRPLSISGGNCLAADEGADAAAWFSRYLERDVRLARVARNHDRIVDPPWIGNSDVRTHFQDGFPLLVALHESVELLNKWLQESGGNAVKVEHFRANVNITGLPAFSEHNLDSLMFPERNIEIKIVKPCTRCVMVDVDQRSGTLLSEEKEKRPLYQLVQHNSLSLRGDKPKPVFAENAYLAQGAGNTLRVGDAFQVKLKSVTSSS